MHFIAAVIQSLTILPLASAKVVNTSLRNPPSLVAGPKASAVMSPNNSLPKSISTSTAVCARDAFLRLSGPVESTSLMPLSILKGQANGIRFAGKAQALAKIPDGAAIERLEVHADSLKDIKQGELVRIKVRTKANGNFEGRGFVLRKFLSPMDLTRHKMKDPVFAERITSLLNAHPEIKAALDRGDRDNYQHLMAEAYRRRFREDFPPSLVIMDEATGTFHYLPQDLSDVWINGVKSTEKAFDAVKPFAIGCKPQGGDDCLANSLFNLAVHNNEAKQSTAAERLIKGRSTFEEPDTLQEIHDDYKGFRPHEDLDAALSAWRQALEQLTRTRGPRARGFDAFFEPELRAMYVHLARRGEVTDDVDDFVRFLSQGGRGLLAVPTRIRRNGEIADARIPKGVRPIVDYRAQGRLSATAGVTHDQGIGPLDRSLIKDLDNVRYTGRHAMVAVGVHRFNYAQTKVILSDPKLRAMFRVPAGANQVPPLIVAVDSNRSAEGTQRTLTRYFSVADLRNESRLALKDLPPKPWTPRQIMQLTDRWLLRRNFFIKAIEEAIP